VFNLRGFLLVAIINPALAQAHPGPQAPVSETALVTPDNFNRAETDMYFGGSVKEGGLGTFRHNREAIPIDKQMVIRMNRDTLYSLSVFDLDAGPVTVSLPNPGQRFMSMQVIDEDHYTPEVIYGTGSYTFTREKIGTRYVSLGVRILVDPTDPQDMKQVHALQDAITVTQPGGPGQFEVPDWDQASQKRVREALLALAKTLPDTKHTFGARGEVDPVRHLIGTAFAFGGNPEKDALYLNVTPSKNDGTTVHRLTVKDVPVDAFWSISVYNAGGYFQKNAFDAYSLNSLTAKKDTDGSVSSIRRLRRQDRQLPAHHAGLELHGPSLSSTHGDSGRHMEVPGGAGGELNWLRIRKGTQHRLVSGRPGCLGPDLFCSCPQCTGPSRLGAIR
jgi:hypothetical protein